MSSILLEICEALGWQGGTRHQVIEQIKRLHKQNKDQGDEVERLERCRVVTDQSWKILMEENTQLKQMVEELEAAMRGAYGCLEQYESTGETDRINDAMCCLALPD